jgi:transcription elongation factor Elf1
MKEVQMSEIRLTGVNDTKSIDEYDTYLKCPNCSGTFLACVKTGIVVQKALDETPVVCPNCKACNLEKAIAWQKTE